MTTGRAAGTELKRAKLIQDRMQKWQVAPGAFDEKGQPVSNILSPTGGKVASQQLMRQYLVDRGLIDPNATNNQVRQMFMGGGAAMRSDQATWARENKIVSSKSTLARAGVTFGQFESVKAGAKGTSFAKTNEGKAFMRSMDQYAKALDSNNKEDARRAKKDLTRQQRELRRESGQLKNTQQAAAFVSSAITGLEESIKNDQSRAKAEARRNAFLNWADSDERKGRPLGFFGGWKESSHGVGRDSHSISRNRRADWGRRAHSMLLAQENGQREESLVI